MSPRAVRVVEASRVSRFAYGEGGAPGPGPVVTPVRARPVQVIPPSAGSSLPHTAPTGQAAGRLVPEQGSQVVTADDEQGEAFAKGYSQGERAGLDMAARQLRAVHDRLGQTLDQLVGLREDLTYRTERQVVELALAMAARILHREILLDRELLLVMARIAIDRLGDATTATIKLHPDDEAAARGARESWPGGSVTIVTDAAVRPGGCVVQTPQGEVEVGVDAQVKELATALLGDLPLASQVASR